MNNMKIHQRFPQSPLTSRPGCFIAIFMVLQHVFSMCSVSDAFRVSNHNLINTSLLRNNNLRYIQKDHKQNEQQKRLLFSSSKRMMHSPSTFPSTRTTRIRSFGMKKIDSNNDDDRIRKNKFEFPKLLPSQRKRKNNLDISDDNNEIHIKIGTVRKGTFNHMKRFFIAIVGSSFLFSNAKVANAAVTSLAVAAAASTAASGSSAAAAAGITSNHITLFVASLFMLNIIGSASISLLGSFLQHASSWYMLHLTTSPLMTKAVTAGVIGITGDYMAQWLEYMLLERKEKQDVNPNEQRQSLHPAYSLSWSSLRHSLGRTFSIHGNYHSRRGLSILADGMLVSGPLMHLGYNLFETIIPVAHHSSSLASSLAALSHVLADSIILDSIFIASTFIMTGIFEGCSIRKELIPQFRVDYLPSLKASWLTSMALLPIEFVCFRCLPLSFRVLAVNFIDVVWDAVISFMAHRNRNRIPNHQNRNIGEKWKCNIQQHQRAPTDSIEINGSGAENAYSRISLNSILNSNHIVPDAVQITSSYPIIE